MGLGCSCDLKEKTSEVNKTYGVFEVVWFFLIKKKKLGISNRAQIWEFLQNRPKAIKKYRVQQRKGCKYLLIITKFQNHNSLASFSSRWERVQRPTARHYEESLNRRSPLSLSLELREFSRRGGRRIVQVGGDGGYQEAMARWAN